MIKRDGTLNVVTKEMFGGPGESIIKNLLVGDEFCGKGRLFAHNVLKPGVTLGNHQHVNDFEAYYILKGVGDYDDNGTPAKLYPGDVAYCPEGERHAITNNGTEDLEFIALILFDKKD